MYVIKLMALELSFLLMIGLAYFLFVMIAIGICSLIERITDKWKNT